MSSQLHPGPSSLRTSYIRPTHALVAQVVRSNVLSRSEVSWGHLSPWSQQVFGTRYISLGMHWNKSTSFEATSQSSGPWAGCSKAWQPSSCDGPCLECPSSKGPLDLAISQLHHLSCLKDKGSISTKRDHLLGDLDIVKSAVVPQDHVF